EPSIMDCHDGFYFDPGLGHCYFADQVDCVLDSSDASTTDFTTTVEDTTESEGDYGGESSTTGVWTDITTVDTTAPGDITTGVWSDVTTTDTAVPGDITTGFWTDGTTTEATTTEATITGDITTDFWTDGTTTKTAVPGDSTTESFWTTAEETTSAALTTPMTETTSAPTAEDTTNDATTAETTTIGTTDGEGNYEDLVTCPDSGMSFHPHPSSCSKFIQCNNGEVLVINCAAGFYFDPIRGHCYFADQVDCVLDAPETTTAIDTTTEQNGGGDEEDYESGNLVDCPEKGTHFLPHPRSCSKFVKCLNGLYRVINCVDGLHFDAQFGWCDYPSKVECAIETIECPDTGRHFLPHPSSCSKFVKCNEGDYMVVECVEGLHFNANMGWCENPNKAGCTIEDSEEDEDIESSFQCPGDTQKFFPHPTNCNLFIECNFGISRVLQCFNNLHWNANDGHCDFPENAKCQN
ncbi:hypothetical protein Trydic_g21838, partial [Trypoxylus dichotomus]